MNTLPQFTLVITLLFYSLSTAAQSIVINEVMAANKTVLADEDGDFPDWIELYNPNSVPVDLTGLSLSDDADSLALWSFPSTVLLPNTYKIVFCSLK